MGNASNILWIILIILIVLAFAFMAPIPVSFLESSGIPGGSPDYHKEYMTFEDCKLDLITNPETYKEIGINGPDDNPAKIVLACEEIMDARGEPVAVIKPGYEMENKASESISLYEYLFRKDYNY